MSSVNRRTVVWLALLFVVTGMVVTLGYGPAAAQDGISWQSAGDSYSSGEGVLGNKGPCAQSERAYGPLAAQTAANSGIPIGRVTFTACTGATSEDFLGGDAPLWDWSLEQAAVERFDVLTFTFGGNDVAFSDVLIDCLPIPDHWTGYLSPTTGVLSSITGCDISLAELNQRADWLLDPEAACDRREHRSRPFECPLDLGPRTGSLIDFYFDVVTQKLTESGTLYVVGYPSLFAPVDQWPGWVKVSCQGIGRGDTQKLDAAASHLTAKLGESVRRANEALGAERVVFLDRYQAHRAGGHELCGPGADWLNGLALNRGAGSIRWETSFHPNAAGHEATALELATRVRDAWDARPLAAPSCDVASLTRAWNATGPTYPYVLEDAQCDGDVAVAFGTSSMPSELGNPDFGVGFFVVSGADWQYVGRLRTPGWPGEQALIDFGMSAQQAARALQLSGGG